MSTPSGASSPSVAATEVSAPATVAPSPSSDAPSYVPPSVLLDGVQWHRLCVAPIELRLDITLSNGQAFGWARIDPEARQAASEKAASKGKSKRKRNAMVDEAAGEDNSAAASTAASTAAAASTIPPAAAPAQPVSSMSDAALDDKSLSSCIEQIPVVKLEVQAAAAGAATPDSQMLSQLDALKDVSVKPEPFDGIHSAATPPYTPAALPSPSDQHFVGVLGHSLIGIRQTADDILYREHYAAVATPIAKLDALLRDYLHLPAMHLDPVTGVPARADMLLAHLYPLWSRGGTSRFQQLAQVFPGVRLLRQEPMEALFSFICSSNNHISRISGMLQSLRRKYGEKIDVPPAVLAGLAIPDRDFFAFPTLDALCSATEQELRDLGFGYRAKYIVSSAHLLRDLGGVAWLHALRLRPRAEVEKALEAFAGVGPKVASCVALFSLDGLDAIPVDTHVWQIAVRDYATKATELGLVDGKLDLAKVKSLTPRIYTAVGDTFRALFGSMAGWAHCILFLAELPEYKRRLAEMAVADGGSGEAASASASADTRASVAASTPSLLPSPPSTPAVLPSDSSIAAHDHDATDDDEPMQSTPVDGAASAPLKEEAPTEGRKRKQAQATAGSKKKASASKRKSESGGGPASALVPGVSVPELLRAFPQRKRGARPAARDTK